MLPLFLALLLTGTSPPAVFEDPLARFQVELSPSWIVKTIGQDGMPLLFCGACGGSVQLGFLPGESKLELLMSSAELEMKNAFGPSELSKKLNVDAGGRAGQIAIYRSEEPRVGRALFGRGRGVALVVPENAPRWAARRLLTRELDYRASDSRRR